MYQQINTLKPKQHYVILPLAYYYFIQTRYGWVNDILRNRFYLIRVCRITVIFYKNMRNSGFIFLAVNVTYNNTDTDTQHNQFIL